MAKWKYGATSTAAIKDLHKDLKKIVKKYAEIGPLDVTIYDGKRTKEVQFSYYKRGRMFRGGAWHIVNNSDVITHCDGTDVLSKHQSGEAFDFRVVGHKYERNHMLIAVSSFITIAEMLWEAGEIDHVLRSGANWDSDQMWITSAGRSDQVFMDIPHLELLDKKRPVTKKAGEKATAPAPAPVKTAPKKSTPKVAPKAKTAKVVKKTSTAKKK